MNPSTLSQVIDETFPTLDQSLRTEINQKVSMHFLETIKSQVFVNNTEGLQQLQTMTENEQDEKRRSKAYGKLIIEKFLSLPKKEQALINSALEKELVRVMHEIYKAYV